jgi:hypothetical protein
MMEIKEDKSLSVPVASDEWFVISSLTIYASTISIFTPAAPKRHCAQSVFISLPS